VVDPLVLVSVLAGKLRDLPRTAELAAGSLVCGMPGAAAGWEFPWECGEGGWRSLGGRGRGG